MSDTISKVTVPLSPDLMVEMFNERKDGTNRLYVIETEESQLQGRGMLLYLANLKIPCVFDVVSDELMLEYLTVSEIVDSPQMKMIHANMLGIIKNEHVLYPSAVEDFSIERMIDFITNNAELFNDQCMFVESIPLFVEVSLRRVDVEQDEEDAQYITVKNQELTEFIDDELNPNLGINLFSLLAYDDFLICYLTETVELSEQTYYSRYFDEYMFGGKNLFGLIGNSAFFGLLLLYSSEDDELDEAKNAFADNINSAIQTIYDEAVDKYGIVQDESE
jgi:hypothetical protein